MNGYHELKIFRITRRELERGTPLPDNWKPMYFKGDATGYDVICRKFHRKDDPPRPKG